MRRSVLALCVLLALGGLTGCSGGGPYCDAVDASRDTLTSFDERTEQGFAANAEATAAIAEVAPAGVKKQWRQIAKVTKRVTSAQQKAGIALEDLLDDAKVDALSQADIDRLDAAFEAFNDTKQQREDVVKNVNDECGIDLSQK